MILQQPTKETEIVEMEGTKVGVGGGEVRRLHIIYFLSRLGGGIEHPHLIRVHHLARNGVYLRGGFCLSLSLFLKLAIVMTYELVPSFRFL